LFLGENSLPAAAHSRSVVIPRYKGKAGHPPLIHRSIFGQLLGWRGPEGLGGFLKAQSFLVTYLDVEDPFILRDIDTPHDMQSLISERNLRGPSGFHS
jgi:CTP:molybdopterin cytidylyltransferase MocA